VAQSPSRTRFEESSKIWELYLAIGGSLDPDPILKAFFYIEMQLATTPAVEATSKMLKRN
jgi:hypothetical protein